ncbi:alpha/beta fold hydrolase [Asanoa siamensis]|uniref:Hydrolase n=1 Tax=Asanoa siamensis TaxID=926357 RepID=A0ABQ4CXD9_9ACTN|nr:alpha/beta fold hydrolase [Asanoa siamensis]GIF75936.1 putative hydrolase [Asanoa siamensis]
MRFTNDGLTFAVTDTAGGPGPLVVLLHGFPQDRRCWDGVAPALAAAGYRVVAPDQRGYSPAARPTQRSAYTLPQLAGDVLALADAAGARRFHLVGHDLGASVAWHLAGHHPDRLLSLACLSVPHPAAYARALLTGGQAVRSWYVAAFQVPRLAERVLCRGGGAGLRAALVRGGLSAEHADRYAARAADPATIRGPLAWYRAALRARRTGPIDVPTLFAWSDGDRFVSRAAARRCGRYVRGPYRSEVFEGVSHWLPEEVPERVAASLLAHFARFGEDASPSPAGKRGP